MTAVWFCRCPEVVVDDDGRCWPCRIVARVVGFEDFDSTSGPVLVALVRCDGRHLNHVVFDELDLLT